MTTAKDLEGNTPLHHACYEGKLSVVKGLWRCLPGSTDPFSCRNYDGDSPVHLAAAGGHVPVVRWLIRKFPGCAYSLGDKRRNILHVAIRYQKQSVVEYILTVPGLAPLIHQRDVDGNGTIHLGVSFWDHSILLSLLEDGRLDKLARNGENKNALQLFLDTHSRPKPTAAQQREALEMLSEAIPLQKDFKSAERQRREQREAYKQIDARRGRDRNSILVVATLMATVTFAAGFTVPGGYRSESNDVPRQCDNAVPGGNRTESKDRDYAGEPILLGDVAFKTFLIAD